MYLTDKWTLACMTALLIWYFSSTKMKLARIHRPEASEIEIVWIARLEYILFAESFFLDGLYTKLDFDTAVFGVFLN